MEIKSIRYLIVLAAIFIFSAGIVLAVPAGPLAPSTLTQDVSSKMNTSVYSSKSLNAEAGNLTQITMTSVSQTKSWQGYYGNISGTILLDDASNFTMYSWTVAEPNGQVYVVNRTITDWTTAHCFNYTAAADGGGRYNYTYDGGTKNASTGVFSNLTAMENFYNISIYNLDGINETFNSYSHDQFYVGTINILANSCPSTWINQNDTAQTTNFQELLLQVNDSTSIIWTAIIENNLDGNDTDNMGYNGNLWDFQILVAEDGSSEAGQDVTTQYYFYVELS